MRTSPSRLRRTTTRATVSFLRSLLLLTRTRRNEPHPLTAPALGLYVPAEQIAQQQRIAEAAASQAHALEQLASVPEPVKRYLISLWTLLNQPNPNLAEIHSAYEQGWNRLTDKFFPKQEWPDAEVIAPLVNHGECPGCLLFWPTGQRAYSSTLSIDEVFLTLYRELYYRHIIARLQPDLRDRIASYEVRCPLSRPPWSPARTS